MAKPIPLSGGKKMLPTREDLERQPLSFFAAGKKTGSPKYTISGVIQDDEGDPVPGVLVTLSGDADDTATTGVAGTFEFEDLSRGDYTVTPTKSQWVFTPASRSVTGLSEDTALAAFEGVGSIYSISGTISGDIATGVTVTLSGDASDSVVTGGDGTYVFEDLPDGDYTVTPTLAEYSFSPTSTNVTINNGNQSGKDFVSSVVEYAISGNVKDWEGANLSGVLITVTGDGSATDTTDASGNYSIDLPNGSYTFTPTKTGVTFNPTSLAVTVSGAAQTGKNFTEQVYEASGDVVDSGDTGIEDVLVSITGDQTDSDLTDSNGAWAIDLPIGSYVATPTKSGYTFAPTSDTVEIVNAPVVVDDFVGTAPLAWGSGAMYIDFDDLSLASDIDPADHPSGLIESGVSAGGFNIELDTYTTGGDFPNITNVLRGDNGSLELVMKIPETNIQENELRLVCYQQIYQQDWMYVMPYHSSGAWNDSGNRRIYQYHWNAGENVRAKHQYSDTGGDVPPGNAPYLVSDINKRRSYWVRVIHYYEYYNNRIYVRWDGRGTITPAWIDVTSPGLSGANAMVDRIRFLWGSTTYHPTYAMNIGAICITNQTTGDTYDGRWE